MKMAKVTLLGLALFIIMAIWIGTPKYYQEPDSVNTPMVVQKSYAEVLFKPESGYVRGELSLNDEVTLTGNYCKIRYEKEPDSLWAEIYYEENYGWLPVSALREK